jgi:PAS domain S-box-containing protein
MVPNRIERKERAGARAAGPTGQSVPRKWFSGEVQYSEAVWMLACFASIDLDYARAIALSIFLGSMASVVIWLATRIGQGLPHRRLFAGMSFLYVGSALARVLTLEAIAWHLPVWFVLGMKVFLPAALVGLSLFMVASIPMLLKVLRASDEVQNLRGQSKLRALVQAAPMAVVSVDCDGKVTSWNPAAEKIFGWTEKEMLGTFGVTWAPNQKLEQFALHERTLRGEVTRGFESERINRSGQRFPVSISAAPLHDDTGRLSGVMATIEDISERKRIEQELKEKTATLTAVTEALNSFLADGDWGAASKILLRHALEQTESPCGFLGIVLEGPKLRVLAHEGAQWDSEDNRQLYEGKIGQQAAQGYFDLEHHGNLFGEILLMGQTVVSNDLGSDARSRGTPGGHPRVENLLGVPIFKGSTVVGLLAVANRRKGYTGNESRSLETMSQATGVLFDSYRQNLKRAQLEEQRSRLEGEFRQAQKMEVLGQLSGGIAHDFNNTLMVLSGSAELLEKSLPANSSSSRYVDQIRRTVERAAAITKQLLAFSRKQVLDITPIDLHEVLTDSEFMLPRLLGADVQLTFQHQAAHSWIRADAAQLEQAIANLAINARDAMPNGGLVTISTRNAFSLPEGECAEREGSAESGWVVLEVQDTGTGMDEETRAHIFEPFFTTKPEGKGTGLGLPTVYGIVCQFGGHIYVHSRLEEGTRFSIYFPQQNPPQSMPQTIVRAANAEAEQQLTILLADDEPSLRGAIAEYLRGVGYRVLESQSAEDALELARDHSGCIDVLLTDIVMPGLRGTELAREVQQLCPDVHVIYISGYAQSLPEAQVPRGAVFLQKPFRLAYLLEQLKLVPRKV